MSFDFSKSSKQTVQPSSDEVLDAPDCAPILHPLDLSTSTIENSTAASVPTSRATTPNFLNAPKDTYLNNVSVYARQDLPHISGNSIAKHESVLPPQNTLNSTPEDLSASSRSSSSEITNSPDPSAEDSKSKVTVRFSFKKSKRFLGTIRFYLSKSITENSSRFKNFMSSLKDTIKNSVANTVPSSKTIKHITNTVVSTLKGCRLPECLHFRDFSLTSINKRKRHKYYDSKAINSIYSQSRPKSNNGTFLNPIKKPEFEDPGGFQFAKPKIYECGYCHIRFYKMPLYLKHIRRHAEIIRCESCDKAFLSLSNKRRHQIQCNKKFMHQRS